MEALVLAADTSMAVQTLALVRGRQCLGELVVACPRGHSQSLLGAVEHLFSLTRVDLAQVDLLAIGLGPGSFTGLRIGLALFKGLAMGRGLPLVGVSSLWALAAGVGAWPGVICSCVDARKGEVYAALYRVDAAGGLKALGEEMVLAPERLVVQVEQARGEAPLLMVGSGVVAYEGVFRGAFPGASYGLPHRSAPSAPHLAWRAQELAAVGGVSALAALEPRYLRPSDAEIHSGAKAVRAAANQ